jgi:hypothetical protein
VGFSCLRAFTLLPIARHHRDMTLTKPKVRFAKKLTYLRVPRGSEKYAIMNFCWHSKRCLGCYNVFIAGLDGDRGCHQGRRLAKKLKLYIYTRDGKFKLFSEIDRTYHSQVQLEIRTKYDLVRIFLQAGHYLQYMSSQNQPPFSFPGRLPHEHPMRALERARNGPGQHLRNWKWQEEPMISFRTYGGVAA